MRIKVLSIALAFGLSLLVACGSPDGTTGGGDPTELTVLGAAYLVIICLIPELLVSYAALPFYFGGTSLLIVVSVTMDTVAQVHGHLLAHQYEGLVKKAKLKGARRR